MAQSAILKVDIITDAKKALDGLNSIGDGAEKTGGRLAGFGKVAAGAFAAVSLGAVGAAVAAGAFAKDAIGAASDLQESVSKTAVVFGDATPEIIKFSQTAARALGLSKNEALTAASGFQTMFTQIGLGAKEAQGMSTSLVTISADLASFNNVAGGAAEVTDLISAAMRGEYDSIQRMIPTLNAAAVEQRALADTHKTSAKELTNAEKAAATYALIMEGAGAATGDFARTSDGMANQQRIVGAEFENLKAKIGGALTPVVAHLFGLLSNSVLPVLEKVGSFLSIVLADAFQDVSDAVYRMLPAIKEFAGNFRDAVVELIPKIQKFAETVLAAVVPAIIKIAKAIKEAAPPIIALARDYLGFLAENVLPKVSAGLRVLVPIIATVAEKVILLAGWLAKNRDVLMAILAPIATYIVLTQAWAAGVAIVTAAQTAWTVAVGIFNAVLAMNPIMLVVIAIAALVAAIVLAYNRVGWFRAFVDASFDAIVAAFNLIKNAAKVVFEFISDKWPLLLIILTGPFGLAVVAIQRHWDTIVDAVGAVIDWIKNHWQLLLAILTGPIGLAVLAVKTHFQTIKDAATDVWKWVTDKFQAIADFISGLVTGIGHTVGRIVDAIKGPMNVLLRAWNRLEFTVPRVEIDLPGPLGSIGAGPWTVGLPDVPLLASGGMVARTGLAVVHAGEQFSGVGRTFSSGGNVTINVTTTGLGADAPSIQRAVANALRGYTARNGPLDIPVRGVA